MTFDVDSDKIGAVILIVIVVVSTWATLMLADACGSGDPPAPAVSGGT